MQLKKKRLALRKSLYNRVVVIKEDKIIEKGSKETNKQI
jgi:hypothetical protein